MISYNVMFVLAVVVRDARYTDDYIVTNLILGHAWYYKYVNTTQVPFYNRFWLMKTS